MTNTFTSNDVIRYYFGEVSLLEKNEIESLLLKDEKMQELYCSLHDFDVFSKELDLNPSKKTIESILLYSANFCPLN